MKSIVTKYTKNCAFCGRQTESPHHLIFGKGYRKLADEDGLTLPACDDCHMLNELIRRIHDNPMAEKLSKMCGQLAYEKNKVAEGMSEDDAREMFRKRYGQSFL